MIAITGYCIMGLSSGPNYYLIATVQKTQQLIVIIIAATVQFICGYFLSSIGLVGIAWSIVVSSIVYVVGLWLLVVKHATQCTNLILI
jgi:hypothetical protein